MVTVGYFRSICLAVFPNILRFAENGNLRAATRDITTDIATMKETAMNRGADCQNHSIPGQQLHPDHARRDQHVRHPRPSARTFVITNANFFRRRADPHLRIERDCEERDSDPHEQPGIDSDR